MKKEDQKFSPEQAHRLLHEERLKNLPPIDLLTEIGVTAGQTVVDVGCGNGYFTLPAAKLIGPEGKIYACDISASMLEKLAERNPPPNVLLRQSKEYELPVDTACADIVLAAFVVHEVSDPGRLLREMRRILKDSGRLWVLEWKKQEESSGPPGAHRISLEEMTGLLEQNGFQLVDRKSIEPSFYSILAKRKQVVCGC